MRTNPLLFLLLFGFLQSCSHDPVSPTLPPLVRPNVGSTFTMQRYSIDSTMTRVAGTDTTLIAEVIATGRTGFGRNDLTLMRDGVDSFYYHYGANMDLSMIPGNTPPPGYDSSLLTWITLPFGGPRTIDDPPVDTVIGGIAYSSRSSITYVGIENVTTPAGTFVASKVKRTSTFSIGFGAAKSTSTSIQDLWFAPAVGFVVKDVRTYRSSSGSFDGFVFELKTYSLR